MGLGLVATGVESGAGRSRAHRQQSVAQRRVEAPRDAAADPAKPLKDRVRRRASEADLAVRVERPQRRQLALRAVAGRARRARQLRADRVERGTKGALRRRDPAGSLEADHGRHERMRTRKMPLSLRSRSSRHLKPIHASSSQVCFHRSETAKSRTGSTELVQLVTRKACDTSNCPPLYSQPAVFTRSRRRHSSSHPLPAILRVSCMVSIVIRSSC